MGRGGWGVPGEGGAERRAAWREWRALPRVPEKSCAKEESGGSGEGGEGGTERAARTNEVGEERAERGMRVVLLWRVLCRSRSRRETKSLESGSSACVESSEQPVNGAGYPAPWK